MILSYEQITNIAKLDDVNESVYKTGNIYKVKTIIEVPTNVVNAFIKKVKEEKGPDIMDNWSQVDIAELIVNHIATNFINADNVPVTALTGDDKNNAASTEMLPGVQPVDNTSNDVDMHSTVSTIPLTPVAQPTQDFPEGSIE